MASVGYSKTPLGKKLGVKNGFTVLLHNTPNHYFKLFEDWPEELELVKKGASRKVDFMHLFYTKMTELEKSFPKFQNELEKNGLIWISWPKGASKLQTNLNRDSIRDYVLRTTGLVDVKVAAIDQDWSGLKFVFRLENR